MPTSIIYNFVVSDEEVEQSWRANDLMGHTGILQNRLRVPMSAV